MTRLFVGLATVCISVCCAHLCGEAETDDVKNATEDSDSYLEQSSNADSEDQEIFKETMDSGLKETGLSEDATEGETIKSDDTDDPTEELSWLEQEGLKFAKENYRRQLRKNFAQNERGFREEFGEDATKDEIIEKLLKEFEEAYKERKKTRVPRDVKIGMSFQYLEELIPELVGTSTTWKTTEHTTLFHMVTTVLAKHYKMPVDKAEKLETLVERLIEVVPEKNQGTLGVETKWYTQDLMLDFKNLYERIEPYYLDKVELIDLRDDLRSLNDNANTKKIDRFISCVDDIPRQTNKAYAKVLSSLSLRLEKTVATVEKWRSHSDEAVSFKNIDRALQNSILSLRTNASRVIGRVPERNCYLEFDVDSLKDDYSLLLRKPNEN